MGSVSLMEFTAQGRFPWVVDERVPAVKSPAFPVSFGGVCSSKG